MFIFYMTLGKSRSSLGFSFFSLQEDSWFSNCASWVPKRQELEEEVKKGTICKTSMRAIYVYHLCFLDVGSVSSPWRNISLSWNPKNWGTWVAQLVGHPPLDFGSGHDPRVVGSSPMLGSALGMEPVWDSISLFLCPSSQSRSHSLSLCSKTIIIISKIKFLKTPENCCAKWSLKFLPALKVSDYIGLISPAWHNYPMLFLLPLWEKQPRMSELPKIHK